MQIYIDYTLVVLKLQVKYVIWSKNLEYAALLSKHTLTLVSRKLQVIIFLIEITLEIL